MTLRCGKIGALDFCSLFHVRGDIFVSPPSSHSYVHVSTAQEKKLTTLLHLKEMPILPSSVLVRHNFPQHGGSDCREKPCLQYHTDMMLAR